MLHATLWTFLLSVVATLAASQSTAIGNGVAAQYGESFRNIGGKVLRNQVNAYVIFYGDWTSAESQTDQMTFLKFINDVSSSNWFRTFKEYTDDQGAVTGPMKLAAALTDSGSQGLVLNSTDVHKQIVLDAVQSGYLSASNEVDSNGVYVIVAGKDVTDSEFCHVNCGYNANAENFQYMFIGYPGQCSEACMPPANNVTSPNNSPAIDAAITIFSHEIQDVLTDPHNDAWIIRQGDNVIELGDFCSGSNVTIEQWFGQTSQVEGTSASYNLDMNGSKYLVQTVFSREKNQCVLSN